ncbi:hypothetical protein MRX96_048381 [Rhipicephalus microplus]
MVSKSSPPPLWHCVHVLPGVNRHARGGGSWDGRRRVCSVLQRALRYIEATPPAVCEDPTYYAFFAPSRLLLAGRQSASPLDCAVFFPSFFLMFFDLHDAAL